MTVVSAQTVEQLAGISGGDLRFVEDSVGCRETDSAGTGLDARTCALAKVASLIALDAPPASYAWQVANALDGGATPEDVLGALRAVAPQVGGPRVVAAAPQIMVALGLSLPDGPA